MTNELIGLEHFLIKRAGCVYGFRPSTDVIKQARTAESMGGYSRYLAISLWAKAPDTGTYSDILVFENDTTFKFVDNTNPMDDFMRKHGRKKYSNDPRFVALVTSVERAELINGRLSMIIERPPTGLHGQVQLADAVFEFCRALNYFNSASMLAPHVDDFDFSITTNRVRMELQDLVDVDVMSACGFTAVKYNSRDDDNLAIISTRLKSCDGLRYERIQCSISNHGQSPYFYVTDSGQTLVALQAVLGKDIAYGYLWDSRIAALVTSVEGVFFEGTDISMMFRRPVNDADGLVDAAERFFDFYRALMHANSAVMLKSKG